MRALFILLICLQFLILPESVYAFLTASNILQIPYKEADYRIPYGEQPRQFGDLRLPNTKGPYPVVVIIHGGCWLSRMANVNFMSPLSEALTKKGYATWNIEYRAADSNGGGWPGTFQDVGNAVDFLRKLAPKYNLDLTKVIILGHSAGGHLALWAAARHKLPKNSEVGSQDPLIVKGVISLAGPGDLRTYIPLGERVCKNNTIFKMLVGATPDLVNQRISQVSPFELLPTGVKQIVITGDNDKGVPPALGEQYVNSAKQKGDDATFMLGKDSAHYESVAPGSHMWPMVEIAVDNLLNK
ncbi:MAG: alpha/beta hydrolase [Proteobacteria bacterium]|nr:alpha/beta hydrolase [Pseudomonadota bacterium]